MRPKERGKLHKGDLECAIAAVALVVAAPIPDHAQVMETSVATDNSFNWSDLILKLQERGMCVGPLTLA